MNLFLNTTERERERERERGYWAYISVGNWALFDKLCILQATMPSCEKNPSQVPMWKGVKSAYLLIAMCLFPLAIGGYWAYGNMVLFIFSVSYIPISFLQIQNSQIVLLLNISSLVI